jgi:predicted lactoylglutathione lyase
MADTLSFFNLPVADVAATRAFFAKLGFTFNEQFSDESTACMRISDLSFVMFLSKEKFAGFAPREAIADPAEATGLLITFSVDTREAVDVAVDAAIAAGGTEAGQTQDYGFMYGRGFHDLDGQYWSAMWMDAAVAAGADPADAGYAAPSN